MTDVSAVDEAAEWADALVRRAHRGPGDTIDAAMQRAARKHGIAERVFWALRYRRPKDVWGSVYVKLRDAYRAECMRQEGILEHQLEVLGALPKTEAVAAAIAATEELLRDTRRERHHQEQGKGRD